MVPAVGEPGARGQEPGARGQLEEVAGLQRLLLHTVQCSAVCGVKCAVQCTLRIVHT